MRESALSRDPTVNGEGTPYTDVTVPRGDVNFLPLQTLRGIVSCLGCVQQHFHLLSQINGMIMAFKEKCRRCLAKNSVSIIHDALAIATALPLCVKYPEVGNIADAPRSKVYLHNQCILCALSRR